MRVCPVCESRKRVKKWRQTFLVPKDFTQPNYLDWFVCKGCGMIYADSECVQSDYDTYYKERYGFGVEDAEAIKRQQGHAQLWAHNMRDKDIRIMDFGGVGVLSKYLAGYGFKNVFDIGAGENLPGELFTVFAEHVFEHIYDLPDTMRKINASMLNGGLLIVDGPEASGIAQMKSTPMLDFHQKHINHFSFYHYLHLAKLHGFVFIGASNYMERNNPCVHLVFTKTSPEWVMDDSIKHIKPNIDRIVQGLKRLGTTPVIIWGCGDIALHALSIHLPNVRYFVDKDPAFKGQSIQGKWVLDKVNEGETAPIVIIAQGQRQAILDNIKQDKLTDEVIIL